MADGLNLGGRGHGHGACQALAALFEKDRLQIGSVWQKIVALKPDHLALWDRLKFDNIEKLQSYEGESSGLEDKIKIIKGL